MQSDPSPYDALLLVSFGGPEKPEDVVPFLENVTRGRGIPRERLEEVGEHYFQFGGRSPINDQNRAFLAALREDLAGAGIDLPVYWGNRNWDPYLTDTVAQMAADGITQAACFVTSAYSSYSSCRQYRENLFDAVEGVENAPHLDKLRHYFNHPGFVEPVVDALAALAELPDAVRDGAHLVFVTHSIPLSMNEGSGPDGGAYVAQHRSVATEVVERVRQETGRRHAHELVYCSRSGAAAHPLARARHQRPPRAAQRPGRQLGRDGAGGLRVRPHGGHLRPRHRGRRHRREAGAARDARGHAGRGPAVRVGGPEPAARAGEGRARR